MILLLQQMAGLCYGDVVIKCVVLSHVAWLCSLVFVHVDIFGFLVFNHVRVRFEKNHYESYPLIYL